MINFKTYRLNSLIIILYFYQYGLLIPFNILAKGQYPIMIFSLFLVLYAFTKNTRVNLNTIILFIVPFLLLFVKLPFEGTNSDINVANEFLISYLTIGLSGIFLGSLNFSLDDFLYYGYKIAWVNFFTLFLIPLLSLYGSEVNYMRFGYALLPSIIFSFIYILKMKKLAIILFLLSFLELLIFGARGAMFSVVIFCVLYLFFVSKLKMKVIFSFLIFVIYFGLKYVLTFIIKFLAKYKIESYAITKYLNVLNGNSFSSTTSGRDIIYETALSRMNESFLFGSPFNTCYIDTGSTYYHNILLDILVNFGVFVLVFFLLFMFLQFYRIGKTKNKEL